MQNKSIVAISSAIGSGAISIIRMSGKDVLEIAQKVFTPIGKQKPLEPRVLTLGTFRYGNISDKCLAVYFKAPNSYTGQDIVEFQCHGGVALTNEIYNSLTQVGCTPATKGEFSKLAFLNGKLSLDEAEGVIDLINAESESELRAGYNLVEGKLKREVETIQDSLTETLAKIEVTLDYPEEDLEEESKEYINTRLCNALSKVNSLLSTVKTGKAIKDGTRVLIYGRTNAGKSSLLNALLNYDRAIVTDISGTTRDVLEETYIFKGYKFILIDTAGIRNTDDIIENIGIDKSKSMVKSADIILSVIDGSLQLIEEDYDTTKDIIDKNSILIVNKSDLGIRADYTKLGFKDNIVLSTQNPADIDNLKELLLSRIIDGATDSNSLVITNIRHASALEDAKNSLLHAIDNLSIGTQLDLISIDIKSAWLSLGDITGNSDNEKIIDEIFNKFCVGK